MPSASPDIDRKRDSHYNSRVAKILVFDKDSSARERLKVLLGSLGHEAVLATDGYSVLPLAEQHKPALVILDYSLPEADGFEILKRLRGTAACAATPVIFASATPKFEIEMTVMDTEAVGYVDKPVEARQLKDVIDSLLPAAAPPPRPREPAANMPTPAFSGEADLDGTRDDIIELD